ncbi:MAG TPA: LytTR family DNA-binding domain-containing protein [Caulobacteraceae bacterium]|jgi:DNA-binding LytR/AlgR family response regulator|nr:LytTR family DNA-binding domain-containing protein [Caulobacteraceae bacterium]
MQARRESTAATFVAPLVLSIVLAIGGAFGTSAMPLATRLGYWVALLLVGTLVGRTIAGWIVARPGLAGRRWPSALAIAAITSLAMTLVVWLSNAAVMSEPLRPARLLEILPAVVITTLAATVLAVMLDARHPAVTEAASVGAEPARFLQRMPQKLIGADLYAVEAEDHYLRLHTSLGEDLILMRLTDAIEELDGIEGARTHRSWWVARSGFVAADRSEGRASLTLPTGRVAPVSRSYARALREAGWF